jgi:serine protease
VARIEAEPTSGPAPLEVAFDGSSSYDPDGRITFYLWDFGDQQTASGVVTGHTYHAPGEFQATLTVTDNWGAHGHDSATIQVTEAEG